VFESDLGLYLYVKRDLYNRMVVGTVMYGAEAWGMGMRERNKLNVLEMKLSLISFMYSNDALI